MSKAKDLYDKHVRSLLWFLIFATVIYLIMRNIGAFGNVLKVLVGFGAVVLVHEFGHFILAKICDIKVEAFSIFMPPTLLGVQKTEDGWRFRILPKLLWGRNEGSDEGGWSFTIGRKAKASDTEYRIGLIPFGGFVKMLGQDDIGPVKSIDDPRSFANKPIGLRMAVITAGVVFNAISALIVFMIVFLIGIKLPPAVVGGVIPHSPAEQAGLRPGDEIIEIEGKSKNLDFSNIAIAAALSDVNEPILMRVKHEDGSLEYFSLVAERLPGTALREFGILPPSSLTIAEVSDVNALREKIGLMPGDRITTVNDQRVRTYWQFEQIVQDSLLPEVTILAERSRPDSQEVEFIETRLKLLLPALTSAEVASEASLAHIYTMVPRLRIEEVRAKRASVKKGFVPMVRRLLQRVGLNQEVTETTFGLKSGDIILAIGEQENPTYKEFREVTRKYRDRKMPIRVLRTSSDGNEEQLTVYVEPKLSPDVNEVLIGIMLLPVLDAEHAVVAKTIGVKGGPERLEIPRGATITAVDGKSVSSFYDIIREIRKYPGQRITIDWRIDEEVAGAVAVDVAEDSEWVTAKSAFVESIPIARLERLYKAGGPIEAIGMGYRKTVMFIAQAYLTLQRLIGGLLSPKSLMGPAGIIVFSYHIVTEQPLVYYVYFLGLISAVIAVFNFLPLPPLDGGLVVLMLVEKLKGSALSERVQGVIIYTGWVLIGALLLYVTFNDIVRSLFS